jgi:NTE family protein
MVHPMEQMERSDRELGGIVLVLGGGGARGAAQLGVLRALAERGLEPDAVVGTSVGALNAAVCARHPLAEAVRLLEVIWGTREVREVFRPRPFTTIANQVRRRPYLRSGVEIRNLVRIARDIAGIDDFSSLVKPLHIVMTDLLAGQPIVASEGSLEDALCASTAIPGVYPPVLVGEVLCHDGGVTENCSLATAAALNPTRIIAIDLSGDESTPAALRRWSQVIERMCQVALSARLAADFDRFSARMPVTLIRPLWQTRRGTILLPELAEIRERAFAAADRLLQRISEPDGALTPGIFPLPLGESTPAEAAPGR